MQEIMKIALWRDGMQLDTGEKDVATRKLNLLQRCRVLENLPTSLNGKPVSDFFKMRLLASRESVRSARVLHLLRSIRP
jgi:hypothetical protein